MMRCALVCLLLAGLSWGQTSKDSSPPTGPSKPASAAGDVSSQPAKTPSDAAAEIPPDAPVITIPNLCDYASTGKFTDPKCKTVVTRQEFDRVIKLTHPGRASNYAGDIAETYIAQLVSTQKALQMGLDKQPDFAGKVEVLRLLFYAKSLQTTLQTQEWDKVTNKQIEDYYREHPKEFLTADVSRIFLPRFPPDEVPGEKLTDAEKQKRQDDWDKKLKEEADSLRARAAAGGDFVALQNEAFTMTGVTEVQGPDGVELKKVRRRHFDVDQKSVMDLNPGETSPPLYDPTRGYCIFRMDTKGVIPLEKVKGEIHKLYQEEAVKRGMEEIQKAGTVSFNAAYIGSSTPEDLREERPGGQLPLPDEFQTATK